MQRFPEFFLNHWDLFLALGILVGLMLWQVFRGRISGFNDLTPAEAVQLINHENALVLDVREDNEYRDGHIVDSRHIPLGALRKRMEELAAYKDTPVVVSCRSGHRSASACGLLKKGGFNRLYNLRGGMIAWQNAGLPVSKGTGKRK
ncbi:MAG: rhodanese-like domain-containing protein [Thiohalomonadaceae bacterium]